MIVTSWLVLEKTDLPGHHHPLWVDEEHRTKADNDKQMKHGVQLIQLDDVKLVTCSQSPPSSLHTPWQCVQPWKIKHSMLKNILQLVQGKSLLPLPVLHQGQCKPLAASLAPPHYPQCLGIHSNINHTWVS